jgi:hypothetical protein
VPPFLIVLASILAASAVPFIHRIAKVPDIVIILLFGGISWIILTLLP